MNQATQSNHLPSLLAALRQKGLDGELVLEQNDGTRRMHWRRGELVYLQSDAAGEQFGNYLLRQGILDFPGLNLLLATDARSRLGEKVVQTGMMTLEQRDAHLRQLQEQVMINALEHPILQLTWNPDTSHVKLSEDLHLKLDHRHFIWNTFLEAHNLEPTFELLHDRTDWKWEGIPGLLEAVSDLPLNPATAYALSFLGSEPITFDTFLSLSGLHEDDAARIFLILWAVGALTLTQGELPELTQAPGAPAAPAPEPPAPAPVTPPSAVPAPVPPAPEAAIPVIELDREHTFVTPEVPEFIEVETDLDPTPGAGSVNQTPWNGRAACSARPGPSTSRNASAKPSTAWSCRSSWIPVPIMPTRCGCSWAS